MLPPKEKNIYKTSKKNLQSLLSFYFDKYDISSKGAVSYIRTKPSLSLNQIQFIVKNLSESYELVFKESFKSTPVTAINLLQYGFDATGEDKNFISKPSNRSKKTAEFLSYLTENNY